MVDSSTDPIDDSKALTALLTSSDTSTLGPSAVLMIRCKKGTSDLYIGWNEYLGSDEIPVTIRLDSAAPFTWDWSISTNHTATFYPHAVPDFAKRLGSARRLLARVTPYAENPRTVTFDLAGMDAAVRPLAEACGWPGTPVAQRRDSVLRASKAATDRAAETQRTLEAEAASKRIERIELTTQTEFDTLHLRRGYFLTRDIIRNVYNGLYQPLRTFKVRYRVRDPEHQWMMNFPKDSIYIGSGTYRVMAIVGDAEIPAEHEVIVSLSAE